jgi:hypothetical protein
MEVSRADSGELSVMTSMFWCEADKQELFKRCFNRCYVGVNVTLLDAPVLGRAEFNNGSWSPAPAQRVD